MLLKAIFLVMIGILAVPSLCRSKNRDRKNIIDKISPYQGWIGVVVLVWGIWNLAFVIRYSNFLLDYGNFSLWIISIAMAVVAIILGFILGFNLINQHILSKSDTLEEKGRNLVEKLLPLQKFFGIVAIVLGIIAFVYIFIFPF